MNNHKLIIQMLPDYIKGQLTEEEKRLVEKELECSDILRKEKEKTEQYLRSLKNLGTEKVKDDFLDRVHQKIKTGKKTSCWGLPRFSLEITGLIVAVSLIVVIYNPFSEHSITRSNSYITNDFTDAIPVPEPPAKEMAELKTVNETKLQDAKKESESESDNKNKLVKKAQRHSAVTVPESKSLPVDKAVSGISSAAEIQSPLEEKSYRDNDRPKERLSSATSLAASRSATDNLTASIVKTIFLQWSINSQIEGVSFSAPDAVSQEKYKVARSRRSSRKENAAQVEMEMNSDKKRDPASENDNDMVQEEYLFNAIESCGGTCRKIEESGNIVYRITIHSSKMDQFIAKLQLKGTVSGTVQDATDDLDISYAIELRIQ